LCYFPRRSLRSDRSPLSYQCKCPPWLWCLWYCQHYLFKYFLLKLIGRQKTRPVPHCLQTETIKMPPHKIEQFRGIQFGAIRINSMSLDCMQWVSMHVRVFLCTLGNFLGDYEALDRISEAIFVVTLYIYISIFHKLYWNVSTYVVILWKRKSFKCNIIYFWN